MAQNIFEQYGIKEVADVQFEALSDDENSDVKAGDVVLYLDTLKVSTIENTAETTDATGGKGNVPLITWDYGREITVTLEDALFTPESLAVMMGGKGVEATSTASYDVRYTQSVDSVPEGGAAKITLDYTPSTAANSTIRMINYTTGKRFTYTDATAFASSTDVTKGDRIKLFYDVTVDGTTKNAYKITIDAKTFPGTYKIYGDTLVRSQHDGSDTAFQFVIPKAKVNSEVTFTMEAEGDPTTFEMTLRVLRDDNGDMMHLIKYDLGKKASES